MKGPLRKGQAQPLQGTGHRTPEQDMSRLVVDRTAELPALLIQQKRIGLIKTIHAPWTDGAFDAIKRYAMMVPGVQMNRAA